MFIAVLISLALLIAFVSLLLFALTTGATQEGILSNLAAEALGIAVSIPVVYFLVERAIALDRKAKWKGVRKLILRQVYLQTMNLLDLVNLQFTSVSALDLVGNEVNILKAAQRFADEGVKKADRLSGSYTFFNFLSNLEEQVASMVSTIRSHGSVLDDEPELFQKALELEA